MKQIFLVFSLLISSVAVSQDSLKTHTFTRSYVPLGLYRHLGHRLTKQDSLNFRINNNDTLVLVDADFLNTVNEGKVRVRYEPKDSAFLEIYKNVVFANELQGRDKKETIKLWKEDVKIMFDSTVPPQHRAGLLDFAATLSADIDSLNIYEVKSREQANYFVYYRGSESEFDYEPRITGAHGGYYLNWNKQQQLNRGILKINSYYMRKPESRLRSLKFYFLKSLGYFHSSGELPCESYFSACAVNRELTAIDKEILKYHYSYGVCKGVTQETFEKLHRDMKEKLKEDPNARLFIVHSE